MSALFDVIVVGGGPAGLAAAINAASEGLTTMLVDSKERLGGQASASSLVENYPGFPDGISGKDLTSKFIQQAAKFKAKLLRPTVVRGMTPKDGNILVTTDDEDEFRRVEARAVILALGLSYKKLNAVGVSDFLGRGVYYGMSPVELKGPGHRVCIVGGANSAGQAAMHLAGMGSEVTLIVRSPELQMSNYLTERIRAEHRITVLTEAEVGEVLGDERVSQVILTHRRTQDRRVIDADGLCIFIGASPKTYWLNGLLQQTKRGYVVTGNQLETRGEREPYPFETSMPGVFACGDVREGSIKRIASAVGEGSVAVQQVKAYLAAQTA